MITFTGDGSTRTCDGVTRRGFLHAGALGAMGLSLSSLTDLKAMGEVAGGHDERSCIMIFNLGAPSQIDLFDPKPDAPAEVRGPFSAIRTKGDFQLTELLPLHARIADKFSLVRSVYHTAAAVHDVGQQMMQTGRLFTGGVNAPHAGSALQFLKGSRNGLPAHVILPEPMGPTGGNMPHGQDGGFLGKDYDPFVLGADPSMPSYYKVPDPLRPSEIGEVRIERRKKLRDVVDGTVESCEAGEDAKLTDSNFARAFKLMTSTKARAAFDLTKEPAAVRERYGMTRFGQSCLLARRLVEAGARFVTLNTFVTVFDGITWDIHGSKPFTSMQDMKELVCPMYDQGYSALIEDLDQRGMLDNTLVCNLAEFGRAPRVNPVGGRDHWPACWTVYFAGGGVRGGRAVGRSDEIGAYPAERPVTPAEVVATIYKSLGVDPGTELPGPQGQPYTLLDPGTQPIDELF